MSINTADFAALAVTIVLFAVIYYLDYKKGRSIENIGREIFMI